ncbi:uncharacterized protein LOC144441964 [Glandiceps talaboti]
MYKYENESCFQSNADIPRYRRPKYAVSLKTVNVNVFTIVVIESAVTNQEMQHVASNLVGGSSIYYSVPVGVSTPYGVCVAVLDATRRVMTFQYSRPTQVFDRCWLPWLPKDG